MAQKETQDSAKAHIETKGPCGTFEEHLEEATIEDHNANKLSPQEEKGQEDPKAEDEPAASRETEEFWILKGEIDEKDVESEPEVVYRSHNKRVRMVRVSGKKSVWNKALKEKKVREKRLEEEDITKSKGYKYGKIFLVCLALFSIPIDGWKLYQGVEKSQRALDGPTPMEVFDFYTATISTHVLGLAAAVDNSLVLTLGCRLLSTMLYQSDYAGKGNSSVPTDPKELQKYIKEKVPKHRLPKGYTHPPDDAKVSKGMPPGMDKMGRRRKPKKGGNKKKATSKAGNKKPQKKTSPKKPATTSSKSAKAGPKKGTNKKP